jgi:DNA-binding transcriptional MerR regulator
MTERGDAMEYTVKQLSDLAGVTPRTLHYYHEIDLLVPSRVGVNGYRYYRGAELFRLQQILFLREMGLRLEEIGQILDHPDYDPITSLQEHRRALAKQIERLELLISTIDKTITRYRGGAEMAAKEIFRGLTKEEQEQYRREATERWGEEEVIASYTLWESYMDQQKQEIMDEGNAIYAGLAESIPLGVDHPETQALIARWHRHLRYFYEPSIERMRGLGEMYVQSPEFADRFRKFDKALPKFLNVAIQAYCDDLEVSR